MSSEQASDLIAVLVERQQHERLSGRKMAARLGISPAQWHRLVNGQRQPNVALLQAAIREFKLTGRVVDFLTDEVATS